MATQPRFVNFNTGMPQALQDAYGGTASSTTFLRGDGTWATPPASGGTVTNVSAVDGLLFITNPTTTPVINVLGTSGGIPYFTTNNSWSSSAVLAANAIMVGGGAGAAPATITTGTGVVTAIGNNINTAGGLKTLAVTTISAVDGLLTITNPTTTPIIGVAGTSGGIPYFTSATTWASSAALGSGTLTALTIDVNTTGGITTFSIVESSVLDYIPVGLHAAILNYTSTTDLTTYIQNAVNAGSSSGLRLYFPAGQYTVAGTVTVNRPGLVWGDGEASKIISSSASADIFDTVGVQFLTFRGLSFSSSTTRTSGSFIQIATNRTYIEDVHMEGAFWGVNITGGATVCIVDCAILNCANSGIHVRITGNTADIDIINLVTDNFLGTTPFAGIGCVGGTLGDLRILDCNIIRSGQALYLAPAGGGFASIRCTNTFFDTSARGLYAFVNGGSISRCDFNQCWFSSATFEGVRLETSGGGQIVGMEFNSCHVFAAGGVGLAVIDTGTTDVKIRGGAYCGNSSHGIAMAAGVTRFSVVDVTSGSGWGFGGNGGDGVHIASGASDNYVVSSNILVGNSGAAISDGGTGINKAIVGNVGALPTTTWQQFGNAAVTITNNGTYNLGIGSGLVAFVDAGGTASGVVFTWFGNTTIISDPQTKLSTTLGTANKLNIAYNGTNYEFENKTGSTLTLCILPLASRTAN